MDTCLKSCLFIIALPLIVLGIIALLAILIPILLPLGIFAFVILTVISIINPFSDK